MASVFCLLVLLPICLAQFDPNALNQNFGTGGFGQTNTTGTGTAAGTFDPNAANAGFGGIGGSFGTGGTGGFGSGSGFQIGGSSSTGTNGTGTFDPNQFASGGGTSGTFDPNSLNNFGAMPNSTMTFGKK